MRKEHSKLIDKVISSLDWDSIFEVYKAFKRGIGEGSNVIPGIKRKPFSDSLTKNDIKGELKIILKQVIDGDISDITYGPWIINWDNGDWEPIEDELDEDIDEQVEENIEDPNIVNSRLEVIYAPQRIALIINSLKDEQPEEEINDSYLIEGLMQKAIKNEDYELASKFRDILKHQDKEQSSDI
jgi:hypothetical protein